MVRTLDRLEEITWQQLLILLFGRFLFNASFRMIYPLLALFASGLAVDLRTASLLVTVQVGVTLLSPVGGIAADRWGERRTMLFGMVLFCLGCLIAALANDFSLFLVANVLIGLGSSFYNPAIQAYASERSSYARRGRVLGILELSWAGSALIGVALLTWLTDQFGSWAPAYSLLTALGVIMLLLLFSIPPDDPGTGPQIIDLRKADNPPPRLLDRATLTSVIAVMVFAFFALTGIELMLIAAPTWAEADFGITTQQLGFIYGLVGLIELVGSGGSALFVDRIGKRRAVLISFVLVALIDLLLPLSGGQWFLFIALFLAYHLWFEFGIVSLFPLISELAPSARGTVIALSIAIVGLGRMVGSLIGPWLLETSGYLSNGVVAAIFTLIALLACGVFVREGGEGVKG
jgi:predicted MFS family arabinose efflux permease